VPTCQPRTSGNEGLDDVEEVDLHEKQLLSGSCRLMTVLWNASKLALL